MNKDEQMRLVMEMRKNKGSVVKKVEYLPESDLTTPEALSQFGGDNDDS